MLPKSVSNYIKDTIKARYLTSYSPTGFASEPIVSEVRCLKERSVLNLLAPLTLATATRYIF